MPTQGEFFERPEIVLSPAEEPVPPVTPRMDVSVDESTVTEAKPDPLQKSNTPRRALKDLSIPKLYYSISEVSRLTELEPYVLRYWETEFDELRPQKNRAGNRVYSNRDIKFILRIKELLREQRYTIEGAKVILKQERLEAKSQDDSPPVNDPAQMPLDTKPSTPQAVLPLEEIRTMKQALLDLRAFFVK